MIIRIKTPHIIVAGILFAALLLRGIFVFVIHPPENYLYSDMKWYHDQAVNLSQGHIENAIDTFHPPGTPYLYSIFFRLPHSFFWLKVFNVLAGTLTCLFIYGSTRLLFNRKAAPVALVLASVNYLFIDSSGYLMSETPFILGLSAAFYFLLKSVKVKNDRQKYLYSFLTGLCIALSASFRVTILLFVPILGLWWLFNFRKYRLAGNVVFYFLGFLPLIVLMLVRVWSLTGQWGGIATCGGATFYEDKVKVAHVTYYDAKQNAKYLFGSPVAYEKGYRLTKHFDVAPFESTFFYQEGLKEIRSNIPRALVNSIENVYDLFCSVVIWPTNTIEGVLPKVIKYFNIMFCFAVVFPAFFLFFLRWKHIIHNLTMLGYLLILVILIQAFVFIGDPRHRVPFDIFFIMIASYWYATVLPAYFRLRYKGRVKM